MKKKTNAVFGLCGECIAYYKPQWIGKDYKIVGCLKNPKNWVNRFDQVIEVDDTLYDCAGSRIGKKKWEVPWFITGNTFKI